MMVHRRFWARLVVVFVATWLGVPAWAADGPGASDATVEEKATAEGVASAKRAPGTKGLPEIPVDLAGALAWQARVKRHRTEAVVGAAGLVATGIPTVAMAIDGFFSLDHAIAVVGPILFANALVLGLALHGGLGIDQHIRAAGEKRGLGWRNLALVGLGVAAVNTLLAVATPFYRGNAGLIAYLLSTVALPAPLLAIGSIGWLISRILRAGPLADRFVAPYASEARGSDRSSGSPRYRVAVAPTWLSTERGGTAGLALSGRF